MDRQSCTETLGATLLRLDTNRLLCLGFIKSKVPDLHDLRQRIYEAVQALTHNRLRYVFRGTVERWEQCHEMYRGQVELY
jgi:hypothetical protein